MRSHYASDFHQNSPKPKTSETHEKHESGSTKPGQLSPDKANKQISCLGSDRDNVPIGRVYAAIREVEPHSATGSFFRHPGDRR